MVAFHWTHKARIQHLYKEGFTIDELAIMYHTTYYRIKNLVQHLIKETVQ